MTKMRACSSLNGAFHLLYPNLLCLMCARMMSVDAAAGLDA